MTKPTCSVDGCDKPHDSRGLCHAHYARWSRWGDRCLAWEGHRPTIERFLERVVILEDGCWAWQGALKPNGYGRINHDGREVYVHRFAYEWYVGPIPEGAEVDHSCSVRHCVSPEHLQAVTPAKNKRLAFERRSLCRSGLHPKPRGKRCEPCNDALTDHWAQHVDSETFVVAAARGLVHRGRALEGEWVPRCRSFRLSLEDATLRDEPDGPRCANCFREPRGQRL